jgi:hypothetical protein
MSREKITHPDGSWYEGDIQGGKRHGQGIWVRPDGTKYNGQWQNDKPNGQGTINWPDGRKYIGEWKEGKRHGYGSDISADGKMQEGEWVGGEYLREQPVEPVRRRQYEESDQSSRSSKGDYKEEGNSFLLSLIDVSMKEMITPKIIRVLYIIGLVGIGLGALGAIVTAIFTVGSTGVGSLIAAIIAAPLGAFIGVVFLRVYLEIIILLFNIYDQLKEIRKSLIR